MDSKETESGGGKRKHRSGAEIMSILKAHVMDGKELSAVCKEHEISPSQFYRWQKIWLDQGAELFERKGTSAEQKQLEAAQSRMVALEERLKKKDGVIAELLEEHVALKKSWGSLRAKWVPHEVRDEIVDFVRRWSGKAELAQKRFVPWLGISGSKLYDWVGRYGKVNEHNSWVSRDHWLEQWEKELIAKFYKAHPFDGYRRQAYMLLDAGPVAVSASSVYRVLKEAGLLERWNRKASKKGTGFVQPAKPHEHWHIDISYLNLGGTFYYLCSVLDGYSRMIVHWEIGASMTEAEVECVVQKGLEKYPGETPRIISDNGPQFIARDFKTFVRESGLTHVRTSPYYPQSNGKLERWHGSYKTEALRPQAPGDVESARRLTEKYVKEYNEVRLHSAIGYIAPKDKLEGRAEAIFAERDRKLEAARTRRAQNRQAERERQKREQQQA